MLIRKFLIFFICLGLCSCQESTGEPEAESTSPVDSAPEITSIKRNNPSSSKTNSATVIFNVVFSEVVNNLDAGDFSLSTTGTVSGSISTLSVTSGKSIQVTVNTVSGDGSLRLDLNDADKDIVDQSNKKLSNNTYTSGELYTIDNTSPNAPNTPTLSDPSSSPSNDLTPTLNVSGVEADGVLTIHSNSDCSSSSLGSTNTSSTNSDITLSSLTTGSYQFYAKFQDSAGNTSGCSSSAVSYVIDTTAPSAPTSITLKSDANHDYKVVAKPTITVSGVANGDTVKVFENDQCSGSEIKAISSSSTSVEITDLNISSSSVSLYATSTDSAGNSSSCSSKLLDYNVKNTDSFIHQFASPDFLNQINTIGSTLWVDNSDHLYVAGTTNNSNIEIYKYDSSGKLILKTDSISVGSSNQIGKVAVDDNGNIYLGYHGTGSIGGNWDIFIVKFNSSGSELWSMEFGTTSNDQLYDIDFDSSGNLYVSGGTEGAFAGFTNQGSYDNFIAKINTATQSTDWVKQFGGTLDERGRDMIISGTDIFLASGGGYTQQASVYKTDLSGNVTATFITPDLYAHTIESLKKVGNVIYAAGHENKTDGNGSQILIIKLNLSLQLIDFVNETDCETDKGIDQKLACMFRDGTTSNEEVWSVEVDTSKNIYVGVTTLGNLDGSNGGLRDAAIVKYTNNGTLLWKKQFNQTASSSAASQDDFISGLVFNSSGELLFAGEGRLNSKTNANSNGFIGKIETDGTFSF